MAQKIKEALSFGDLSENSEYDAAKNEQAQVEEKIVKLENMLKHAKVIEEDEVDDDTVTIGCKVKVLDIEFDEELEYTIVGSTEVDLAKNRISNVSPIGAALIGAKKGETIEANTPGGIAKYKVLDIKK